MALTEEQKLFPASPPPGCHLSHSHIYTAPRANTCTHMYVYACTRGDIDFDQSVRSCVGVTAREAHNLRTFWPPAQIRAIKNRLWDNDTPARWRSNSKDVSRPPPLPRLITASEWLRRVITDGAEGGGGDLRARACSTDTAAGP